MKFGTAGLIFLRLSIPNTQHAVTSWLKAFARLCGFGTVRYLGIEVDDALAIAEQVDI